MKSSELGHDPFHAFAGGKNGAMQCLVYSHQPKAGAKAKKKKIKEQAKKVEE